MPDGMDYALVERTVLDGLGKIFDTTPGTPDTGSYVTEATLLAWIKGKTLVPGYLYNGVWYSDSGHTTPVTGEAGSLYVEQEEDVLYRWDGEAFSPLSDAQLREDIQNGTVTAKKAECDVSGNVITTTYAKKAELDALDERVTTIETAVASGYKYKGDCTHAQLPSSGQQLGDMWYVTDRNDGYVWNGSAWRPMNDIGAAWVLCDDGNYRIGIRSRS